MHSHRLIPIVVAAGVAASASALSLAAAALVGAPSAAANRPSRVCKTSQLRLSGDRYVSPESGEHARQFVLANRSHHACKLRGFPGVSLYDRHGRRLPFRYRRGGQYVRARHPHRVLLHPGAHAYFLVAKYRCDAGTRRESREIRVYPPDGTSQLRRQLRRRAFFGFCRATHGPDERDPGNLVHLSPVTAKP